MMTVNSQDTAALLGRLAHSKFRGRFKLAKKDITYIGKVGLEKIEEHVREFIMSRLAAAFPKKDGRQTPLRGHPVFVAQHATATCCRKCLSRWHKIAPGRALRGEEIEFVVSLIMAWINSNRRRGGRQ